MTSARNRDATVGIGLLLLCGLFLPTSIDGEISRGLVYIGASVFLAILAVLVAYTRRVASPPLICVALAIHVLLLSATLLSPLSEFRFGAYIYYLLLSVLFVVNFRQISLSTCLRRLFAGVNVLLLGLSVALMLQQPHVIQFFVANYSAFYPELVPAMLRLQKPVLVFGSHSIAGFFYYIFFLLNFLVYKHGRERRYVLVGILYLVFSLSLQSVTAYVYVSVGVVQLAAHFGVHRVRLVRVAVAVSLATACLLIGVNRTARSVIIGAMSPLFVSQFNGLAARYTSAGTLAPNMEYIRQNPLLPIGVRYAEELWYVDSGPLEHVLRGSMLMPLTVYGGFFLFLKSNLRSGAQCVLIFVTYLAFEFGFSNLLYMRTLFLMPFIVVFLNGLQTRGSFR